MRRVTLGDLEITPEMQFRFLRKVKADRGCWLWTGKRDAKGYGRFCHFGRQLLAHRVYFAIEHGALKDGVLVCHHCDNPPCVNPAHLFAGDHRENALDCSAKGRLHNHNAAKTQCQNGHAFSGENTFITRGGKRGCRTCRLTWSRQKRHKTNRTVPSRAGLPAVVRMA